MWPRISPLSSNRPPGRQRLARRLFLILKNDKGSNILLDATLSLVKLADFGAAKKLNFIDKSRYDHSKKGDIVGTPYWMAPEVVRGHGCGRRSDIWSAGCTILEMLTLKPPFKQFEPLAALFHIASASNSSQIFDSSRFSPNLSVRKIGSLP